MSAAEALADRFHAALTSGDADTLNAILSDDVTFAGPVAHANGRKDTVDGLVEMSKITQRDEVDVRLADDANALLWCTVTTPEGSVPTATWLQFSADKITAIRTVFSR